ncbi:MAG: hypothetical protein A2014_04900 [Spirochaetes bacterium GWF1_49_6]|jgi:CheY-like chemotaxis protein|nr:MAG: hypothetical protein A2014_04900 [Spirochaetes bacterium GWF1_49_6]
MIKILLVEDTYPDRVLFKKIVQSINETETIPESYSVTDADTLGTAIQWMTLDSFDVVFLDLHLPDSFGGETIERMREFAAATPIVIMTNLDNDTIAIDSLSKGFQDYMVKESITPHLLHRAEKYARERFRIVMEKEKLIHDLEEALAKVNTLRRLIPICAHCKKIRDDEGYWEQVDHYISQHSDIKFSHGLCPECMQKLYPEYIDENDIRENDG